MPRRPMRTTGAAEAPLTAALRALRTGLKLPGDFPPAVLAEAERAAAHPRLPGAGPGADATDLPLFTIDPPGSADLDQAMHLARHESGYRVHYAITDVAAFVGPGGALDSEAHRRVQTLYFPDTTVPLHPPVLSASAASLLPGHPAPALLWRIDLDAEGRAVAADVRRSLVRSRIRYDYATAQRLIDTGTAEEPLALLRTIGVLREALERERGGISLQVPEQEIGEEDGAYRLSYRAPRPAEGWNAQISLLTGMTAAEIMTATGTGILRTLPIAPDGSVARLRRSATALGIDWPHHVPYAEIIRSLDPREPRHAAFLQECTGLLRGAGYTVFTGGRLPTPSVHAAVAAEYTHCTAPLRRLVDRYTGEIALAACAGRGIPEWVLAALDTLPAEMATGSRRANTAERETVDLVEAALLRDRVGEEFPAVVIDVQERDPALGTVQLEDPAVVGAVGGTGPLPLGDRVRVRLTQAEPGVAKVRFALV
ncbi:RNB domain-containing ribonuclease [Streptomyces sp. NPDC000594]|uniref:RNB domain-containing ribonuclease n=1 Tax=Streptomyces sp. NPDC000594 TaxID=3154261 RepID=UPI0033252DF8